jgi:hypothetical protein
MDSATPIQRSPGTAHFVPNKGMVFWRNTVNIAGLNLTYPPTFANKRKSNEI